VIAHHRCLSLRVAQFSFLEYTDSSVKSTKRYLLSGKAFIKSTKDTCFQEKLLSKVQKIPAFRKSFYQKYKSYLPAGNFYL